MRKKLSVEKNPPKKKSVRRAARSVKKSVTPRRTSMKSKAAVSRASIPNIEPLISMAVPGHTPSTAPAQKSSRQHFLMWMLAIVAFFGILQALASLQMPAVSEKDAAASAQNNIFGDVTLNLLGGDDSRVSLIATGDILLARFVELKMRKLADYTYPFQKVADVLSTADITFGNLETPLMPGKNTPKGSMVFRGDLEGVEGLTAAGYDVLSVANNHSMNYRESGLYKTIATLKKADIKPVGGGANIDEAHTPVVIEAKGRKIAFYAYVDSHIPPGFHGEASAKEPGIAAMDALAVKNDVQNALTFADMVVVSMHAGREYTREPTQFQKDFAHAAIDAGASAVIGHHPHWVQPVEEYGNGVIFYSLGNFVFDQNFSHDVKTGLVTRLLLGEKGEKPQYELSPVRIENGQPRFLEGDEKAAEMKRLGLEKPESAPE